MTAAALARYRMHLDFDDFDTFAAAAREWDLDFRQLDRGGFQARLLMYGGGPVQLGRARFNRTLIQHGAPPKGYRTFVVPVESSLRLVWRGQDVSGTEVLAFPLDGELHSVSRPDFHVFTIAVREDHLARIAEAAGLVSPSKLIGWRERTQVAPADMVRLRRLLQHIAEHLEEGYAPCSDGIDAPALQELIEVELPRELLGVFAATGEEGVHQATPARSASPLAGAEDFVMANMHRGVGVRELCAVVGRSDRTVRRLFRDGYGMGPKQYVQALRLNAVRRALRHADPAVSRISEVAMRYGFWHMGQFAADYRRQFGDLPSTTLRRVESGVGRNGT